MAMLSGDFNFNLIKLNQNKGTPDFLELLFSNNFILKLLLKTFFANTQDHNSVSGNITTSISDHLPQFLVLENFLKKQTRKKALPREIFKILMINLSNKNQRVLICLQLQIAMTQIQVLKDLFFYLKELSTNVLLENKEPRKIKKLEVKPWITKGIKTLVKRDKLYREIVK